MSPVIAAVMRSAEWLSLDANGSGAVCMHCAKELLQLVGRRRCAAAVGTAASVWCWDKPCQQHRLHHRPFWLS